MTLYSIWEQASPDCRTRSQATIYSSEPNTMTRQKLHAALPNTLMSHSVYVNARWSPASGLALLARRAHLCNPRATKKRHEPTPMLLTYDDFVRIPLSLHSVQAIAAKPFSRIAPRKGFQDVEGPISQQGIHCDVTFRTCSGLSNICVLLQTLLEKSKHCIFNVLNLTLSEL